MTGKELRNLITPEMDDLEITLYAPSTGELRSITIADIRDGLKFTKYNQIFQRYKEALFTENQENPTIEVKVVVLY